MNQKKLKISSKKSKVVSNFLRNPGKLNYQKLYYRSDQIHTYFISSPALRSTCNRRPFFLQFSTKQNKINFIISHSKAEVPQYVLSISSVSQLLKRSRITGPIEHINLSFKNSTYLKTNSLFSLDYLLQQKIQKQFYNLKEYE